MDQDLHERVFIFIICVLDLCVQQCFAGWMQQKPKILGRKRSSCPNVTFFKDLKTLFVMFVDDFHIIYLELESHIVPKLI